MVRLRGIVFLMLITEALFFMKKNCQVTFVSISWTDNSTLWDIRKLKLKGRERLLNGTFDLLEDMDDEHYSFAGELFHDAQGDGNYKLYPFSISKNTICQTYKKYRPYFRNFAEFGDTTNLPVHIDPCLIEKGHYYFKNIRINTENWPSVVPRGYCRLYGYFYKDDILVGNYSLTVLVQDA